MITLEDLKANRTEIIDYLTYELGSENVKDGMNIIANMIGFRGYDNYSVMQFCEAAIKDSGIQDRIIMRNGANASRWIEEHNIEVSKQLKRNI